MNVYEKNMEVLRKHRPNIAGLLESLVINDEQIKLSQSEDGEPIIFCQTQSGQQVAIETLKSTSGWGKEALELLDNLGEIGVVLLFGFGFGCYAIEALERFNEDNVLVIYEATPALLKMALMARDLRLLLSSKKIELIVGEESDDFSFVQKHHRVLFKKGWCLVQQKTSVLINPEGYVRFARKYKNEKSLVDTNVTTGILHLKDFIDKFIVNMSSTIRTPGVACLKNRFKDRAAIIVSAGPSLEKNLHLLNEAKGRALIVAVDAVLQTLVPAGLIPDVVVGIDSFSDNAGMFMDNPLLKQVPFIYAPQYTPDIINVFPGPTFVSSLPGNPAFRWLSRYWEAKGFIEYFGGSVSHLAFATAEYLGARTIALIGQDLCFEGKFHAGEVTELLSEAVNVEVPDFRKGADEVRDIFGEAKYSNRSLLSFKAAFERRIQGFNGEVINATEGGIPIEGAKIMRLSDFIEIYCTAPAIDTFSMFSELASGDTIPEYDICGLLSEVGRTRTRLSAMKKYTEDILKCIEKLDNLRKSKRLHHPMAAHLIDKMGFLEKKLEDPILAFVSPYRCTMETYLDTGSSKDEEIDGIEENLAYYKVIKEAISLFLVRLDGLLHALDREKNIDEMMHNIPAKPHDLYIKIGMLYKEDGIAVRAVKFLEMAATELSTLLNADNLVEFWPIVKKTYVSLAELYLRQFRLYDAREVLRVINDLQYGMKRQNLSEYTNDQVIDELLSLCEKRIEIWENRAERMKVLFNKAKNEYGSQLETGHFYFRVKDYALAQKAYLKVINGFSESLAAHLEVEESAGAPFLNYSRLIGAFFGLSHTYLAMNEPEQALAAIDQASSHVLDLYVNGIDLEISEFFKLFADLYELCGMKNKAVCLYEKAISVRPDNLILQQELKTLRQEVALQS